jgi:hypothetical protein
MKSVPFLIEEIFVGSVSGKVHGYLDVSDDGYSFPGVVVTSMNFEDESGKGVSLSKDEIREVLGIVERVVERRFDGEPITGRFVSSAERVAA